ncbi:MAG: hypothetical protein ACXQT0_00665 [Candidatus Methanofastidiosia archaeon]
MKKKDVLIKIREEEEKGQETIAKAKQEQERLVQEAIMKAHTIRENALIKANEKYNTTIDNFHKELTPEERKLIEKEEQLIANLKKREIGNIDKAVSIILDDFVRYIDAKAEKNE